MDTSTSTDQSANLDPTDQIAELLIGGGDDGEPSGDEDTPTTNEQTTDTDDTLDTEDGEDLSNESTDEEVEEVEESDEEDEDSEPEEPEGSEDYQTVLADAFGLDKNQVVVDDSGNVALTVKVDGVASTQSLHDVVKGFQTNKHNTNTSKALAEEKRNFTAYAQDQANKLQQALEQNEVLSNTLEHQLMGEFEAVDWNELRQIDPAEYAAKRQDYAAQYNRIQQLKGRLHQDKQGQSQQRSQEFKAMRNQHMGQQFAIMLDKNPAWNNKTTYKQDMDDMKEFLGSTYGFGRQDFDNVSDARLIEVVKDAKAYHQGKSVVSKKVKAVPKLQKGAGGRKRPKASKLDKLTKAAKSAKGSAKRSMQTDAVAQLLMGG